MSNDKNIITVVKQVRRPNGKSKKLSYQTKTEVMKLKPSVTTLIRSTKIPKEHNPMWPTKVVKRNTLSSRPRHQRKTMKQIRKQTKDPKNRSKRKKKLRKAPKPRHGKTPKPGAQPKIGQYVRRAVESSGESVDAWLSLLVPGHESVMKRRREERLSMGLSVALSSLITAALLSV